MSQDGLSIKMGSHHNGSSLANASGLVASSYCCRCLWASKVTNVSLPCAIVALCKAIILALSSVLEFGFSSRYLGCSVSAVSHWLRVSPSPSLKGRRKAIDRGCQFSLMSGYHHFHISVSRWRRGQPCSVAARTSFRRLDSRMH